MPSCHLPLKPPLPISPQVFREVKFFGDAEIATLRKELAAHKVQLEQLKAARQVRWDARGGGAAVGSIVLLLDHRAGGCCCAG